MLLGGISSILDRGYVGFDSCQRCIDTFHEILDEPGRPAEGDPEHVVKHEDLPIDMRTRTDPDDRDIE